VESVSESVTPEGASGADTETAQADTSGKQESTQQARAQAGNQKADQGKETKAAEIRRLAETDLDAVVQIKVDGEVRDMTVREAIKLQQLEKASQKKMSEAAQVMKQVQQVMKLAKENPREFLRKTGIDPYEFAESTLAEKFELMQMSPEQKRIRELEEKEREWNEREKIEKESKEKEHLSRLEAQEMEALDKEFGEALLESGIKKPSKYTVSQIAAKMLSASRQGKHLTAKEAAATVIRERRESFRDEADSMDAEAIHEWLGKDNLKKLRDYDVKRVSGNMTSQSAKGPAPKAASQPKMTFKSETEWREHIENMRANLRD